MFDRDKVNYNAIDLSTDEEAMDKIKEMGYTAAPVVIAGDHHWSGFRIEKIKGVIAEVDAERSKSKPQVIIASWLGYDPEPKELAQKIIDSLKKEGYEITSINK